MMRAVALIIVIVTALGGTIFHSGDALARGGGQIGAVGLGRSGVSNSRVGVGIIGGRAGFGIVNGRPGTYGGLPVFQRAGVPYRYNGWYGAVPANRSVERIMLGYPYDDLSVLNTTSSPVAECVIERGPLGTVYGQTWRQCRN